MAISGVKGLLVFQAAYGASMDIFALSKGWPREERFSLTDQIRRSSRSVCKNMGEAWAKRLYPSHFVSKLSDAHSEVEETLIWLDFARDCGYLEAKASERLQEAYAPVVGGLIKMMRNPSPWCGPAKR